MCGILLEGIIHFLGGYQTLFGVDHTVYTFSEWDYTFLKEVLKFYICNRLLFRHYFSHRYFSIWVHMHKINLYLWAHLKLLLIHLLPVDFQKLLNMNWNKCFNWSIRSATSLSFWKLRQAYQPSKPRTKWCSWTSYTLQEENNLLSGLIK